YELIHDTGYELYVQQMVIRKDTQTELDECLRLFVPLVQQSAVEYIESPSAANSIIVEAVAAYDSFWVYGPEIADYSHRTQMDLDLVGNGPNETVGEFDMARIQGVIDILQDTQSINMANGITPEDVATNEYIDPSIGFTDS
ncbi:MAG: ABC transporter substrate-binding protein, partial [Acidimicrobiales bacterium]